MSGEETKNLSLAWPLVELPGVGGERAAQLARLKCLTVGDLLMHRPRRYEDRRDIRPIRDLSSEEARLARGKIMVLGTNHLRGGRRKFEFVLEDDSGSVRCRWWNCNYMDRLFHRGDDVLVYGKLTGGKLAGLDHPETEIIKSDDDPAVHVNRIVPVYPLTEGMPQRWLRRVIFGLLEKYIEEFSEPNYTAAGLPSRREAIRQLHFPDDLDQAKAARRRLALDEFVELQSTIRRRRVTMQTKAKALPCAGDGSLVNPFLQQLEFQLTDAQRTVQMEIEGDLNGKHPMRRLLQGDVGSGKTVVAALSLLRALESGYNGLMMAPTEILAEQHYRNFTKWLEPLGVRVRLHTGARKDTAEPLFEKRTLVIGTHALFQTGFNLERVGLIVIDEQHKFGVTQRDRLVKKGHYPHLLVMTATPIPRTLGLTLYGDLDSSVIDEMPAGRGEVRTHIRTPERWPKILDFLKTELATGQQAFVIFPRVENEDAAGGIKAVNAEAQKLATAFAPHTVAVLHGRLKPEEKEAVMAGFRKNQTQVLLATTVVEVGVDVPNATLMLIENAEQFGLAQLHQLRGRIGRGVHDSHCILLTRGKSTEANERLTVLAETNDGFKVAEADLQLRGPGELVGQDQSGLPAFKFGDLRRDLDLIELARHIALEIEAGR
ncbi:MAG: ATP-dependent DNA helicase RecG [Verrucomicrobiota bacterium]|nr:ATP-dependent DNA helicase RecG [Verrucomicrobiota bacterium]